MLGFGCGYRPHYYSNLAEKSSLAQIDWLEAVTENFLPLTGNSSRPLQHLERLRQDRKIILHGVSLSLGSVDRVDASFLNRIKALHHRIQPELLTDHLCYGTVQGEVFHDLLPLPYTQECLSHVTEKIQETQDHLGMTIAIENVSSYTEWRESEMSEWEFLKQIATRSGCKILLDVNNVYVSSQNHGFDPKTYIQAMNPEHIVQYHLAGHTNHGEYRIDTHDEPICEEVWELFHFTVKTLGERSTLIERDGNFPPFEELCAEVSRARKTSHNARTNQNLNAITQNAARTIHPSAQARF